MVRAFAHGAMGLRIDPSLTYFLFQPVLNNWCNKGHGVCGKEGNGLFNDTLNTFYLSVG